jgi:hypothetical protein
MIFLIRKSIVNKIYKSIWNEQTGTYLAVSENTKAKGER